MDIDAFSHSPSLCNKILQEINLDGLYLYNNTHQTYLFEDSNKIVNCSYILVFLKAIYMLHHNTRLTSMVHGLILTKKTNIHKIALCNDLIVHVVPLPPAEPLEFNAFKTIARLPFAESQLEHVSNTHTQPIYSSST